MYEKQGFYSGQPLTASQLDAMEDGIIEAQELAAKGGNGNDDLCKEYDAYEPILWDGNMEGREYFDFSAAAGEEPGTVYAVKISDAILTSEDILGSTFYCSDDYSERIEQVMPPEVSEEIGAYGTDWLCSVFDTTKISIATGVVFPSTGLYIQHWPSDGSYSLKLSKTVIQKIDKKFIPVINNVEEGTGENATQQTPRSDKVTRAEDEDTLHFSFTGHPEANRQGRVPYGAIGNHSTAMNGRSAALSKHAFAINNSTVAQGEESFAQGYETIAEGNSSSAMGSRTWAKGTASHTEGLETITEADGAHAEGGETKAKATYSHAEGYKTIANAVYSHVEGSTTQTGGFSAHAEGNATLADTNASHAEGSGTKVVSYRVVNESGDNGSTGGEPEDIPNYDEYESAEDFRVRAAACSHAEGNNTTAMGYSSHAEGVGTNAYGRASHAEGWCTQTGELIEITPEENQIYSIPNPEKGMAAHADGYNTKAIANYSQASGFETIADKDAQTVVGKYNNKESRNGSLFVVGAGEDDETRKNALEVISDGEIVIYWEGAYYSLNLMFNLIANAHGGASFFDLAKKQ